MFSMPCRSNGDGNYEVINDFVIDDWLRDKLQVRGWEQLPGRIKLSALKHPMFSWLWPLASAT